MTSEEQKMQNTKALGAALASTLNNKGKVALTDTFSLARIGPHAGDWYFGVKCKNCEGVSPVLPDQSSGRRGNPFSGSGKINVRCHHCPREVLAGSDGILSFRWA